MTLPATTLGYTFACRDGFDPSFRLAQSDEEIVADEIYHRLTTSSVLGDTPEAASWGVNIFLLCGDHMGAARLAALGPALSAALQQSPLIETADVTVTPGPRTDLVDLAIAVDVTAKHPVTGEIAGGFTFLFALTGSTFRRVGDPDGDAGT